MGHDSLFHIFQSDQFRQGLRSGLAYPRWATDANSGYGSPNFIFYAPLTYYLVSLAGLWEQSMIMSMVYVIWAGFFLSGLSMVFATGRMFGKRGSLLAAVVYQLLPFHIIDLYHRGTFAELFAYPILPLFFYFLVRSSGTGNSRVAVAGLSVTYACLILTHLVTGFLFTLVAAFYLLWGLVFLEEKKGVFRAAASLFVGLGISAIYLGPAVLERKFVHIDILLIGIYQFAGNFLFDFQAHMYEIFYRLLNMTVCLEMACFLLLALLFRKAGGELVREEPNRFLITVFAGAFLLTTPLSRPVWEMIPHFAFLQFPWRWIIVMELSLCFLIARVYSLESVHRSRPATLVKVFLATLLVFFAQLPMQNIHDTAISENDLIRLKERGQWRHYLDEKLEYLPVWNTNPGMTIPRSLGGRVSVPSGRAVTDVTKWAPESITVEVQASTDAVIRIAIFFYPGWQVTKDGKPASMEVEKETGAVLVNVPAGAHTIRATFGETRLREISKYASLGSLLLLIPLTVLFGGSYSSEGRRPSP